MRYSKLSDKEIDALIARPISKEEADRLHKANKEDRWMLALFLISEAHSEERARRLKFGKAKSKRKR